MKGLVFDTGPLISLSTNNLLWLLKVLKEKYGGKFYITPSVKKEAVDNPINSKKYKFEAIQILKQIDDNILEIYNIEGLKQNTTEILNIANQIFKAHHHNINIVHYSEIEVLCASLALNADAIVIDEFITRALIENPNKVKERLEKKLHVNLFINESNLSLFQKKVKNIKVIRSVELVTVAFELGFLNKYSPSSYDKIHPNKTLLDALLWGIKLNGCSVSTDEIDKIILFEGF